MIGRLSVADHAVLRALGEPGTRWHRLRDLGEATDLGVRAAELSLLHLDRLELATSSPVRGSTCWSITDLGEAKLRELGEVPT